MKTKCLPTNQRDTDVHNWWLNKDLVFSLFENEGETFCGVLLYWSVQGKQRMNIVKMIALEYTKRSDKTFGAMATWLLGFVEPELEYW